MDLHTRIELFGGPEDGREITLPSGAAGGPMSPLPVPRDGDEPLAAYVKDHQRPHGVWIYKYTLSSTMLQFPVQ